MMFECALCLLIMVPLTAGSCGNIVGDPQIIRPDFNGTGCGFVEFPSTFPNNTEMSTVDFTGNAFVTFAIPEDLTIPHIYFLYLTDNFLESFPDVTSVGHLRKLNLNNNKLTSIDPAILVYLVDLEVLQVNYNLLTSVPDVNIPSDALFHLSLCGNELTSFPELLHLGKHLTTLELCYNHIGDFDIEDDSLYPMVEVLSLNHNALTRFPNISVLGDTVIDLGVSFNQIGHVPRDILESFVVLRQLNLYKAQLAGVFPDLTPVGDTLTSINIGGNGLKDMPQAIIASLDKLFRITLTGNLYTSPPDVGVLLDTLTVLHVGFLAMEDDQAMVDYAFEVLAGHGMQVDLRGYEVSSVPPTLCDSGKDFEYLQLQRIHLVCDCRLRWLKVATLAGQRTDLEAYAACEGGPPRLANTVWEDVTLSDLVCDDASSVTYSISKIDFTCLEMPADEWELWDTSVLECAQACKRRPVCFLFRYKNRQCSLIVQGSGRITDVSNLYKIV